MIKFYKKEGKIDYTFEKDFNIDIIKPNNVDAATEKHVPVCKIKDGKIFVKVGENPHPMTDKHYIMWICLVQKDKVEFKYLTPSDKPEASFNYTDNFEIYTYCNLHGLWKNS